MARRRRADTVGQPGVIGRRQPGANDERKPKRGRHRQPVRDGFGRPIRGTDCNSRGEPYAVCERNGQPGGGLPQGSDPVTIDPANFTAVINNPWWPMAPGSVWTYKETDAEGTVSKVEVTVTRIRSNHGRHDLVVHDVLTEDGEVVEDTFDWYAQDLDGNIWYFGEDTKEFADGGVDTAGSGRPAWTVRAGRIVPADPARFDIPRGIPCRRGRGPGHGAQHQ